MKPPTLPIGPLDLQLFRAMPGNSVLLLPDAPTFTIVAATEGYLHITGRRPEDITGQGLMQAFPNNPADPEKAGEKTALASLLHVVQHREPQTFTFRYDLCGATGCFEERHWQITNKPVLTGDRITCIIHTAQEITAGVKAARQEEALRGLEKNFRELMSAPILFCILKGPDNRLALANDRTLRFWGRTAEAIGQPILNVLPGLAGQGLAEILQRVRTTSQPEHIFEYPVSVVRNGRTETLYIDFIFQPYIEFEGDGKPSGIVCVAHDQTGQVRARQKAEESEHRFRDLIAEADVATAIYFGRDMRIQYANEAMIRLWGKDRQVIGRTLKEVLPELEGQPFLALLDRVYTTGETYWGKDDPANLMVNGQLQTFFFNFTYKALRSATGEIYGILNMASDVTDQVMAKKKLQESERNLRNTILQAPVAMCILHGPAHVVAIANDRIYELWGRSAAELEGKPLFEGLPEVRHQGYEELLHQVYTTGQTYAASEATVNLPRKGGIETAYVNFVYEPFREGDGTISGVIVVANDVTEQVEARKKVEESEQQVRSVVESAPFPIGVYTGREMRITLANQSIIGVWGKGPDVIGKAYADVLPELEGSGIYQQLDSVFATGKPFHARNQRVDLVVDGRLQPYYFNYSFTPLFDTAGNVYGVMNTAAEITDLVVARQKVEQSEQRFQNLVREATVGIIVLMGEALQVAVVNNAYARLIGRRAEDLLQRPIFDIIPETEEAFRPEIEKVRQTGEPVYLYDRHYVVYAGEQKIEGYLNVVYQPYRETDGTTTGVMVVCQDVTAQVMARHRVEEAQETARLAVDAAGLGTFDVDLRTNHLIASERTNAIFDMEQPGERRRFITAIHPEDRAVRLQAHERAYQSGLLEYEARLLRRSGAVRWIRVKGKVFFEEGKPVKLVGVVQDITEEKEFAAELSRKVRERTQELEQFLFVSHHDLQEPLRKIVLFSDMLKSEIHHQLSETAKKRFDKIMDAARRMSAALRDVLDFASLNKEQPLFDRVELDEVVAAVQSDLEVVIAEKDAKLVTEPLPAIRAIPQQMHQLLYNLLSNALKFSKPGEAPVITIGQHFLRGEELLRHSDLEQGRQYVQITVSDNGIGFRQELAEKIFTLFQRLHSKDQYAGTGIGLALCRKVVQNHRGKIWAEGREGEGAAFTVVLPVD